MLDLDLRYIHVPKRAGVDERECAHRHHRLSLPAETCALVAVDVWNDLFCATHVERARRITRERIVPLAEAFRRMGAPVIHAPSPEVAAKYPEFLSPFDPGPASATPDADWPPDDFRQRRGAFAAWARPAEPDDRRWQQIIDNWRIADAMQPQPGDVVIRTGQELHQVLKARWILWLFYVGFAANICIMRRNYGLFAMRDRGYGIVLVRDGTTAIEVADTIHGETLCAHSVITAERDAGYSVSSAELLDACERTSRQT